MTEPSPHTQAYPVQQPFLLNQMTPPPTKRRRGPLIAVIVLAVTVLLGGAVLVYKLFSSPSAQLPSVPTKFVVSGSMTITGSTVANLDGEHCAGMRGHDDIHEGTQVTITDAAGSIIGVGSLGPGKLLGAGGTRQCVFRFSIADVPKGKGFYGVEVSHRGAVRYPEADITKNFVTLTLN